MDSTKSISKLLKFILNSIIKPVLVFCFKLYYKNDDKTKPLPPVENELLLLPAHELARRIRNREVTSVEVVQAFIKRIQEVQPLLNCVVGDCFKDALEEAKKVDEILSSKSIPEKYNEENAPLLGVPFSLKESKTAKGLRCTAGLLSRKNICATEDSDVVRNMRNSGAILLCQTNISELLMWIESRSKLYGISNNPYNLSRIVGGSTGGEASLISSAGSVIGVGSDIGGSIRIPCFFNGIYGHKCTWGLISNKGSFPPLSTEGTRSKMVFTGPMCRYASDLRLLFKVQAGPDYAKVAHNFEKKIDLKKLNYYVITELKDCVQVSELSQPCRDAINKAVNFLESSLNVKVKKLDIPGIENIFLMWKCMITNGQEISTANTDLIKQHSNLHYNPFLELLKSLFGKSDYSFHLICYTIFEKFPTKNSKKYIQQAEQLKEELNSLLGDNSIIISPGFPIVAPFHNQPFLTNTFDFIYFGMYNALGLPATECPMGLCPQTGLPLGLQVVSNVNCDHLTIGLAEYFEKNYIGWVPPF